MGAMSDAVMDAPVLMATRVCLGAKAKAEGERRGDITAKSQVVLSAVVGQTQRKAPIAIRRKGFGLPKRRRRPAARYAGAWRPRDTSATLTFSSHHCHTSAACRAHVTDGHAHMSDVATTIWTSTSTNRCSLQNRIFGELLPVRAFRCLAFMTARLNLFLTHRFADGDRLAVIIHRHRNRRCHGLQHRLRHHDGLHQRLHHLRMRSSLR